MTKEIIEYIENLEFIFNKKLRQLNEFHVLVTLSNNTMQEEMTSRKLMYLFDDLQNINTELKLGSLLRLIVNLKEK